MECKTTLGHSNMVDIQCTISVAVSYTFTSIYLTKDSYNKTYSNLNYSPTSISFCFSYFL